MAPSEEKILMIPISVMNFEVFWVACLKVMLKVSWNLNQAVILPVQAVVRAKAV